MLAMQQSKNDDSCAAQSPAIGVVPGFCVFSRDVVPASSKKVTVSGLHNSIQIW